MAVLAKPAEWFSTPSLLLVASAKKGSPRISGGFLFLRPCQAAFSFLFFIWVQTLSNASSKDSSNDLLLDFTKISFLGMVTLISATLSLMV
jgi:hypothetical protein